MSSNRVRKKHKTASFPTFAALTPINSNASRDSNVSEYEQGQSSHDTRVEQGHRNVFLPTTPIRQSQETHVIRPSKTPLHTTASTSLHHVGLRTSATPVPRMLATPVRSQTRTVQERSAGSTTMNSRLIPTKTAGRDPYQKRMPAMHAITARSSYVANARPSSDPRRGIKIGRPAIVTELSDSEDSSDENFQLSKPRIISAAMGMGPQSRFRAARKSKVKVARKTMPQDVEDRPERSAISLPDSDSSDHRRSEELDDLYIDVDPAELLQRAERFRNSDYASDEVREEQPETPLDLVEELNQALDSMTLREARLTAIGRFPFLRRNLRKVMDNLPLGRKRGHDPNVVRTTGISRVNVVYVMGENEFSGGHFRGKFHCRICSIKMHFDTRAGLDVHMFRHHPQIEFKWAEGEYNSLLLTLTVPEVPESSSESDFDDDNLSMSGTEEGSPGELSVFSQLRMSPLPEEKPFLRGSSVAKVSNLFSSSPVKVQPESPQLTPIRPRKEPAKPDVPRPPRPIDPENPDRYPTPPPLENLYGPAAVYPYISDDAYSCRPGGPKLYDILNELSLEPFGIMAWYIIDKEEDLFQLDTMRDEDKVMQALWDRWIFLNRPEFVKDYERGVRMFIDEYWRYIHRAAGFSALHTWLLVLSKNRFLIADQFVGLCEYYSDLVGLHHWTQQ